MKKLIYFLLMISGVAFGQRPYVIAHRGNSSVAPENTNAAFTKAVEAGADYFELDVQISSDDSLMLMHDADVERTTDGTGTLESMTYAALRLLDAGSWFNSSFTGERIPTLREALLIAINSTNNAKVVIEIKSSKAGIVEKVVQLIQSLDMEDRVIVSSFNIAQLSEAKSLDATIPVMFFDSPVTNSDIDQVAGINGEWVGNGGSHTQELIDYAHTNSVFYNAWTVDNESEMKTLIGQGVDAITTNTPSKLIAIEDTSKPSDVVLISAIPENSSYISLTWLSAKDAQSEITGYKIYRDETSPATTLLDSVGTDTVYIDKSTISLQKYYYRIKAINSVGLTSNNFSNERSATALNDSEPPVVEYITSKLDSITVFVEFNEPLDAISSETTANYNIDQGASISSAKLAKDRKTVILLTSLLSDQSYLLTVQNVKDVANNAMVARQFQFDHKNLITGPIAVYKLDTIINDTLVVDETANHNNGGAKNGVMLTGGVFGNAFEFDGIDDFVQFQNSPSFNIGGDKVTVSLWTKLEYKPAALPGAYGPLFDSQTDEYSLYEDKGNNQLRFKATAEGGGAARPGIAGADVITGEWIYVVGVYDGANAMVYLNGAKKAELALTGNVRSGVIPMLGKSGTQGTIAYLKGLIDEVEIYNRALTETEIQEKYNAVKNVAVPFSIDTVRPVVEYITSNLDSISVLVQFSEPLNNTAAETISNYSIDNGISITSAKLAIDQKTVMLETSVLSDRSYVLTVQNVRDLKDNIMITKQYQFEHKNTITGAIAVYKLDAFVNDTLVMDLTENHNDGKAKNGVKLDEGIVGNALFFDGYDDFVQFQNSLSFDIGGDEVSVSLWTNLQYKPLDLPSAYGPLFDSQSDNYSLYEDRGNNELRFKVTAENGAVRPGIPGANVPTGEWIHVVGVYNGASAKLYLNGEQKGELSTTGNVVTGNIPMLGKSGTEGTPSYFRGLIDEVEIYNRALTDEEILEKYTRVKDAAVPYTPSAINDPENQDMILIYPNPVKSDAIIKLGAKYGNVTIRIVDILGNTMNELYYNTVSEISLDCSQLTPGIYFLNITLDKSVIKTKKIVVK